MLFYGILLKPCEQTSPQVQEKQKYTAPLLRGIFGTAINYVFINSSLSFEITSNSFLKKKNNLTKKNYILEKLENWRFFQRPNGKRKPYTEHSQVHLVIH